MNQPTAPLFDPTVDFLTILSSWALDSDKRGAESLQCLMKTGVIQWAHCWWVWLLTTYVIAAVREGLRLSLSSDLFIMSWDRAPLSPCSSRRPEAQRRGGCQLENTKRGHVKKQQHTDLTFTTIFTKNPSAKYWGSPVWKYTRHMICKYTLLFTLLLLVWHEWRKKRKWRTKNDEKIIEWLTELNTKLWVTNEETNKYILFIYTFL